MKIEEIIKKVSENIRDWDENPFIKLHDLYRFYQVISDSNLKIEICRELLEEIDSVMYEFASNERMTSKILHMKNDMQAYLSTKNY